MNIIEKHPPPQPPPSPGNQEREKAKFLSLGAKFSIFISLLIMIVCTGLSVVFIQQESDLMENALMNTGTILVTTIKKVSTNRVIIQDTDYLETMLEGTLSSPEVVYAIVRDQEGRILVGKSKGTLQNFSRDTRDQDYPLYPEDSLTETFFSPQQYQTLYTQPLISIWTTIPLTLGRSRP